ncbi:MAG: glycosyltransferase family 39 protein [Anaerolineales bacterium]|nr:glycosyltransferase family 39 protein [Anaerolineales bacterium]
MIHGSKKWRFQFLIVVCCFAALIGWRIYTMAIAPDGAPHWDEAAHTLRGILISEDIQQRDWPGFFYDSYRQVYWPPLQSWFVGAAFLIGPVSMVAARAVSLVVFLLAAILLYITGINMTRQYREVAAVIAAILFLTNTEMAAHAAEVMLEIYGILFLIITFLLYFITTKYPHESKVYFLLGLSVAATYFAKANYGILLFMVILIGAVMDVRFRVRKLLTREMFFFLLPITVIFAIWFAYPPKITSTWQALVNVPFGVQEPYTAAGLLFYPRALVSMAGAGWMFAVWLAAFVAAFWYGRDRNVRFLLILITLQFLLGQIHHTKVVRHLLPILPAIFLLIGYVLAQWWASGKRGVKFWLPRAASVGLLVAATLAFAQTYEANARQTDHALIAYLSEMARTQDSLLLIGSMDLVQPSPPVLDWNLTAKENVLDISHSGVTMHYEQDRAAQDLFKKIPVQALQNTILPVLQRADSTLGLRTLYLGLPAGTRYSTGPAGLESFLREQWGVEGVNSVVVLSRKDDAGRFPESAIKPALENLGLQQVESQSFSQTKVTVYQTGE